MKDSKNESAHEFSFINETSLSNLAEQWRLNQHANLKLRHEIGELLLEELGSAKKNRQKHVDKVMQHVAERLGISVPDVSRIRKFAEKFADFQQFREEHPECESWSAVKKLLPDRSQSDGEEEGKQTPRPPTPVKCGEVEKLAVNLHEKLNRLNRFSGKGFGDLPQILTRLSELINTKLKTLQGGAEIDKSPAA